MITLDFLGTTPRVNLKSPGLHIVSVFLSHGYISALYLEGRCVGTNTTYYEKVCLQ